MVKKTTFEEVIKNAIKREFGIEVADAKSATLGYQLAMMQSRHTDQSALEDLRDVTIADFILGDKDG